MEAEIKSLGTVRLLPYAVADGPYNMAADETILHSAADGIASLRFYGWSEPTVSLGYFQSARLRDEDERLRSLPFVRRPTGGDTLVHHHEVTYAIALPAGAPWQTGEPWATRMHRIIQSGLAELGVTVELHPTTDRAAFTGPLCFRHFTAGDLICNGAKVVGSAQRRHHGAILQHGGILLARSPATPELPGIREQAGGALAPADVVEAVCRHFQAATGWELEAGSWTEEERRAMVNRAAEKFGSAEWNRRR